MVKLNFSDMYSTITTIFWVLRVPQGILTLFSNALTIIVICKYDYLRTGTNYYIVSLALSDLISGIFVVSGIMNHIYTNELWFPAFCSVTTTVNLVIRTINLLSLFLISLDRFIFISRPLRYHTLVSARMVLISILIMWIYSITVMSLTLGLSIYISTSGWCMP